MLKLNYALAFFGSIILLAAWACDAENDFSRLNQTAPLTQKEVIIKGVEVGGLACIYASKLNGSYELVTEKGAISDHSIHSALPKEKKDHYQLVFNPLDPNANRIKFVRAGMNLTALKEGITLQAHESQKIVHVLSTLSEKNQVSCASHYPESEG